MPVHLPAVTFFNTDFLTSLFVFLSKASEVHPVAGGGRGRRRIKDKDNFLNLCP